MELSPLILVIVALAAVGGSALLVLGTRAGSQRQKRYRRLAHAHGWNYEFHPAGGGAASRSIFSHPTEGWTLTLCSRTGGPGSGSTAWTEYRDPTLAIPKGLAVLGPDIPAKMRARADKLPGTMEGDLGRHFLDRITGGLGEEAQGLRSLDDDGPGTLLATPGAETALDAVRAAPGLAKARAGRTEQQQPIMFRGPHGLILRLPRRLRRARAIEDFVRLGRALSDLLSES